MIVQASGTSRRKQKKSRVLAFLNGVDVSDRCYYADSTRGFVRLFKWDADGHPYLLPSGREVAREELHGSVTIVRNV